MNGQASGGREIHGSRPGRTTPRRFRLLVLPVFLLAAQALFACGGGGGGQGEGSDPSNMPVEDPTEFYGTQRAVGGEVGAVLSPAAFVMVEEADRASGRYPEGLLVVNDTGSPPDPDLAVGQSVMAFGSMEELQPGEAEEMGLDLDEEALEPYEGGPWMSATTIDVPEPSPQGETTR